MDLPWLGVCVCGALVGSEILIFILYYFYVLLAGILINIKTLALCCRNIASSGTHRWQ